MSNANKTMSQFSDDGLTHIDQLTFNEGDRNMQNILIQFSPEPGQNDSSNSRSNCDEIEGLSDLGESKLNQDDPEEEGSNNADDKSSAALCETLYGPEGPTDLKSVHSVIENQDGQLIALVDPPPAVASIVEGIPNDVLVYCCQPEGTNTLDMFPCKTCGMVVGCVFCLKSHYESVHLNLGLIQYKCNKTTYLKNFTEICNKCSLVCESKEEMVDHRKIHFVTCDVCDMSFDNALFLSNHCKSTHEKFEVIISCDLCEQWFKHLQDLSDHYQTYHEMILCIVCFKRFSNRNELVQHHGTHKIILTDVRPILPYACSKCNRAFSEICELSTHLARDHPKAKATYGTVVNSKTKGRPAVKRKHKLVTVNYEDCGGLSHANDTEEEFKTTKRRKSKVKS